MNKPPDHQWKQFFSRMLSLGFSREQATMASHRKTASGFQEQALTRQLLKEVAKNQRSLKTPLTEVEFVILDTETTGFRPIHGDEIISIAALKMRGHKIESEHFATHIKPSVSIPETITTLTGLTVEHVANAPELKTVMMDLLTFIDQGIITGFHIGHDMAFFNDFVWKNYRMQMTQQVIEILKVLENVFPEEAFTSLDDALAFFSVNTKDRHTALGDVKMTAEIWRNVLQACEQQEIVTLGDLYTKMA